MHPHGPAPDHPRWTASPTWEPVHECPLAPPAGSGQPPQRLSDCRRMSTSRTPATSPTSGQLLKHSPEDTTPSNLTSGPLGFSSMRFSAGVRCPMQVLDPCPQLWAGWEGAVTWAPFCVCGMQRGGPGPKLPVKGSVMGGDFLGWGRPVGTGLPALPCLCRHVQPRGLPEGGLRLPHALPPGVPAYCIQAHAVVLAQGP